MAGLGRKQDGQGRVQEIPFTLLRDVGMGSEQGSIGGGKAVRACGINGTNHALLLKRKLTQALSNGDALTVVPMVIGGWCRPSLRESGPVCLCLGQLGTYWTALRWNEPWTVVWKQEAMAFTLVVPRVSFIR